MSLRRHLIESGRFDHIWYILLLMLYSFSFYFVIFVDSIYIYMLSHASNLVYSLEYEQPVLGANESPKWNNRLEQAANWILPHPSSHPVASFASQSSSTQGKKTMPNHRRLAAICPSKPSSPNTRSKSACDNALGKGLTTMPVMSAWHGRHLVEACLESSGGWHPAWKTETASKLCV